MRVVDLVGSPWSLPNNCHPFGIPDSSHVGGGGNPRTPPNPPGPYPVHGGIAVGEAYRVDHDLSVAGKRFNPHDAASWELGGKAPLLIDPCTEGSGHSLVFA